MALTGLKVMTLQLQAPVLHCKPSVVAEEEERHPMIQEMVEAEGVLEVLVVQVHQPLVAAAAILIFKALLKETH